MYGLINRSIQCFLEDTYGAEVWDQIVRDGKLDFRDFEAMLSYDDALTDTVLDAACEALKRERMDLLADLGSYLVTHPNMDTVRRLLRFGGHTFEEFIFSLDDLHDRVSLAIPDLELPHLELREFNAQSFALFCSWGRAGFGAVLEGVLRALADDYGALALINSSVSLTEEGVCEMLHIELMDAEFADGRDFVLGKGPDADIKVARVS